MNKLILTTALTVLWLSSSAAQWEILNEGFKGSINTIDFAEENIGWVAGSNGTLVKTTDGGESWNTLSINESWNINQIDFISEEIGWAIGSAGSYPNYTYHIWKSSNGGLNWTQQFISTSFSFNSIYAIDENDAFTVSGDTIFKTTNGGLNWIDVSPNLPDRNYNSLWFQNPQTGVVVGSYNDGTADKGIILQTTDGGTSWYETIVNEFNSIYDLQFLDDTTGYFRANLDTTHFLCKTVNMCANWNIITEIPSPNIYINPLRSYQFLDTNLAYAIMGDNYLSNKIMKSVDGGITWQNVYSFSNIGWLGLNKIFFNNLSSGFILSSTLGGTIFLKSSDHGDNWSTEKFNYPLYDVFFFNNNNGLLVGGWRGGRVHGIIYVGYIFQTTDGGSTWEIEHSTDAIFQSCNIKDESVAYSLASWVSQGWSTQIFKTIDNGNNWAKIYENNEALYDSVEYRFFGNEICFQDEENGFAVGRSSDSVSGKAGILFTSDGGENWDLGCQFPDTNNYEYNLKSIHLINSTGWTVGDGGMIVKYSPQTGWVKQTSVTDLPLNKVFFSDDNHGWIAGGYQNENDFQKILLKTTNGGVEWNTVPNVPYLIRDIAFIDNNLGWAIGYTQTGSGGILKTTDGGASWVIDTGNLSSKLNALFIKDNYAWAVGENGLILRNTDAGTVWVEDEKNNVYPTEFKLEQNYPNPFNPTTTIKYQIPKRSFVSIKVYDLLGQEVTILVNNEQKQGTYNVEFNSNNLSSGIYLYQLKADKFTMVRKMVIIK